MKVDESVLRSPPTITIGKEGITEKIVREIKIQIKKKKQLKVKFLKSAFETTDKKTSFELLADWSGTTILKKVGFVVVLGK